MQELLVTVRNISWPDAIDIVLVAVFFYGLFALLRETRSFVALMGFVICTVSSLLLFLLARTLDLKGMMLIFQHFWIIVVLIFLIVFQNEFRRALTEIGQMRLFRSFFPNRERDILDEIVQAVTAMASSRTGGLIVFERRNPLGPYTGTGTLIDAVVSSELIRTIFTSLAPLHDGALIVQNDRLLSAGCILPLTDNTELSKDLGTRHRAALGVSEETDALVIVVSEESGTISVVADGKIERGLKAETLRKRLEKELDLTPEAETQEGTA